MSDTSRKRMIPGSSALFAGGWSSKRQRCRLPPEFSRVNSTENLYTKNLGSTSNCTSSTELNARRKYFLFFSGLGSNEFHVTTSSSHLRENFT